MFDASALRTLSDRERLLAFGYEPHQIIEYADGTAIIDLNQVKRDLALNRLIRAEAW